MSTEMSPGMSPALSAGMNTAPSSAVQGGGMTPALAFGAAMVVNVALFSAMTRLNRVAEVKADDAPEDLASFVVQELPPEPMQTKAPPKEQPPKPKPESSALSASSSDATPDPAPSLDLSLSSLGGLAVGGGVGLDAVGRSAAKIAPARPRVFRRNEVDEPVRKLSCDAVVTPALMARRQGVSGSVRVRAVVSSAGRIQGLRVVATSGSDHSAFSTEALRHFKTCRFTPARKAGQSVAQWVERVYEFSNRG